MSSVATIPTPTTPCSTQAREVLSRYRQADEDEIIRAHLPLVRAVVGRVAISLPAHVDSDDLFSAGLVGLLSAVRGFDPEGGSSFQSYARVRIRGAVLDELRRLDWVPRSIHEKARKVQSVMQQLEQAAGRTPTDEEMSEALELSAAEYDRLLQEIRPATFVCLDAVGADNDSDEPSRHESVADESQPNPLDVVARRELADLIAEQIHQLPEGQRKVLALYYFEDMRLREIAEAFGVTESRICQIHTQAILAIRARLSRSDAGESLPSFPHKRA